MVKVVVHNGVFHSDETLAVALIQLVENYVHIDRLPHQTSFEELNKYTYVVDIGRKFDGQQYFDHHQNLESPASNMLILEYYKQHNFISDRFYNMVKPLFEEISDLDVGKGKRHANAISEMISYMNESDIYSMEQDKAFFAAVNIWLLHLTNIYVKAEELEKNLNYLKSSEILSEDEKVIEMPEYISGWQDLIFEIPEFDNIDTVIWFDKEQEKWKIQSVPDKPKSFGKRGRKIAKKELLPDGIEFIHNNEFFAVGKSKKALLSLLS